MKNRKPQLAGRWPLATLICLTAIGAVLQGCARKPATGPPLVVVIVDRTATVAAFREQLQKYATAAITEYAKQGPMHVVVINLDESPSMDIERTGELTNDEIEQVTSYIRGEDKAATGTDVIGAFDTACQYFAYEKMPPRAFRLLCFTDGLIESSTGQKFRQWAELDLSRLKQAGAQIAVYFVNSQVRGQVEAALAGMNAKVKETNQARDEADKESFDLPGVLQ